jgi:hypothetical protein
MTGIFYGNDRWILLLIVAKPLLSGSPWNCVSAVSKWIRARVISEARQSRNMDSCRRPATVFVCAKLLKGLNHNHRTFPVATRCRAVRYLDEGLQPRILLFSGAVILSGDLRTALAGKGTGG